ncbi:hypothetical protein J2S98_003501 [Arthrobacter oryzae]|nr:hypothetical protein [Arthrobacter oryzae]
MAWMTSERKLVRLGGREARRRAWNSVLWRADVVGESHTDAASLVRMEPHEVSAMLIWGRAALRDTYASHPFTSAPPRLSPSRL